MLTAASMKNDHITGYPVNELFKAASGFDGYTQAALFIKADTIAAQPETGLFVVLNQYPLGKVLSIVAIVLLCTFFITSANSGTFVLSMLTSDGNLNPPNNRKILWGILQAVTAVGLLMAGGLKPLQTISIAAAFPFIFIMIAICIAAVKAMRQDPLMLPVHDPAKK